MSMSGVMWCSRRQELGALVLGLLFLGTHALPGYYLQRSNRPCGSNIIDDLRAGAISRIGAHKFRDGPADRTITFKAMPVANTSPGAGRVCRGTKTPVMMTLPEEAHWLAVATGATLGGRPCPRATTPGWDFTAGGTLQLDVPCSNSGSVTVHVTMATGARAAFQWNSVTFQTTSCGNLCPGGSTTGGMTAGRAGGTSGGTSGGSTTSATTRPGGSQGSAAGTSTTTSAGTSAGNTAGGAVGTRTNGSTSGSGSTTAGAATAAGNSKPLAAPLPAPTPAPAPMPTPAPTPAPAPIAVFPTAPSTGPSAPPEMGVVTAPPTNIVPVIPPPQPPPAKDNGLTALSNVGSSAFNFQG